MGRILSVLLLPLASMALWPEARADEPVDIELVLAVDVSRSVDAREARLQRQGYINAFRDPEVIRAIHSGVVGRIAVTYLEWAGTSPVSVVAGWTMIKDADSALAFADMLGRAPPRSALYTSISNAIDFALPMFDGNGFEGLRRVIDVSGDGPNNWGDLVTTARDRAVAAGITINGLPILDNGTGRFSLYNIPNLDLYYRDCVIGGPGAFLVVAADFDDFARAVRRKLILEIAAPEPNRTPGIVRVQASPDEKVGPPCDIGERLLRGRNDF